MSINPNHATEPDLPPQRLRLSNGVQVAVLSQAASRQAAVSVRVAAGSHDEPADYPGLAHFLEHLLFLDCAVFAGEQRLMPFVQACGGQVNASTQARHTDYFCEVPAERLEAALARLFGMLTRPLLETSAQWREREVVHAEFLARGQDTDTLVAAALGQALPAGHVFAAFQAGTRDSLPVEQAAFQQALRDFHRRGYQASKLTLVLVGPQPVTELQALARRYAAGVASASSLPSVAPPSLLPLRTPRLQLQVAGAPTLHLAFALESAPIAEAGDLVQALAFVQTWLLAESPGGLLAQLRAAQLCTGLSVRLIYQHAGQALWRLSFAGVEAHGAARAAVAAALQDWLRFFAGTAPWADLRARYRMIRDQRRQALTPLALAQDWQEALALGIEPTQGLGAAGVPLLVELLEQMQQPQRCISLFASQAEQPPWPSRGFTLRMSATVAVTAPERLWAWQLPAVNPLQQEPPPALPRLAIGARLQWLTPAEATPQHAQAVLHGCCHCGEALAPAQLLAVATVALREVTAHAEQVGFTLQLSAQRGLLQLVVRGPAPLLPRLLGQLLAKLTAPSLEVWPQALHLAQQDTDSAQLPLRQLLARLPELFEQGAPAPAAATPAQLQAGYRFDGFAAQVLGVTAAGQAQIEGLFDSLSPAAPNSPGWQPAPGRHWRAAGIASAEACVVLFCPLAAGDALDEAGWRLLAHFYQGPFFQRLRSELQLGYALFCGYRQVQGQCGILFAVQSPQASVAQVLAHIRAFILAQQTRLAALEPQQITAAAQALGQQLDPAHLSPHAWAELHWQQHLAGRAPEHLAALQQALAGYRPAQLLRCQQRLAAAEAGWYVLANAAPPDQSWSVLV